jgi:hypothetical protein
LKAENFVPKAGEIIVYDKDKNNDKPRFKIGDGENLIGNLPFFSSSSGTEGAQGPKGDKGDKGADGYTPVKGTDYWTTEDKAEINSYI